MPRTSTATPPSPAPAAALFNPFAPPPAGYGGNYFTMIELNQITEAIDDDDSAQFNSFRDRLREKNGIAFDCNDEVEARTVPAEWIERLASEGTVEDPVRISCAVIEGDLDLQHTVFKRKLSVTDTMFLGRVNFSFAAFEGGINLSGSRFVGRADFRAAHALKDFHLPLTRFDGEACFEDITAEGIFSAEGAEFREKLDFNRADFAKSALFCGALVADDELVQTHFQKDADFTDSVFHGPVFFKGARFQGRAVFDRVLVESSAFFSCDLPKDPWARHKTHPASRLGHGAARGELLRPRFVGDASFIGARFRSSITFSGAEFDGRADFRRVEIDGTALFNPFEEEGRPDIFVPVHFGGKTLFWSAQIKGTARFESAHFERGADFHHAAIGASANFCPARREGLAEPPPAPTVAFGDAASFEDMTVNGSMDFTGAKFAGEADFRRVRVQGGVTCNPYAPTGHPVFEPVVFGGKVEFSDAFVKSSARFVGAEFKSKAVFKRLVTEGNIIFRCAVRQSDGARPPGGDPGAGVFPVTFAGQAQFESVRVRGNAEFDGAQFLKDASFERSEIGGNAYFRPWKGVTLPVRFLNESTFVGMKITGDAEFSGAQFSGDADFMGLQVGGYAYFDARLHYDNESDYLNYRQRGYPIEPVEFSREVRFTGAHFLGQVDFRKARFNQRADFTGVRGESLITFKKASFGADVSFREARFTFMIFDRPHPKEKGWITRLIRYLSGAEPEPPPVPQFHGRVDMRGCTFDRIEVKLRHLVEKLVLDDDDAKRRDGQAEKPAPDGDGAERQDDDAEKPPAEDDDANPQNSPVERLAPDDAKRRDGYDRQPFTQLVRSLRAVGDDRRADYVYLQQRHIERRNTLARARLDRRDGLYWKAFLNYFNYAVDCFFRFAGNYGVQPERLLYYSLALILVGAGVFSQPGAVKNRELELKNLTARINKVVGPQEHESVIFSLSDKPHDLDIFFEALKFSLSQFIPVVDIAPANKWEPSDDKLHAPWFGGRRFVSWWCTFDMYDSVHRLLGAIIVPLLLAAIATGLYRRVQSAL